MKADAWYLWRWTGWFYILTWALENKYTAILSALLYRARGASFKSHPSYDQVEVLVEKTEDPEIIDMAKVFWHEEISRKNKLEIPISQSDYENPHFAFILWDKTATGHGRDFKSWKQRMSVSPMASFEARLRSAIAWDDEN